MSTSLEGPRRDFETETTAPGSVGPTEYPKSKSVHLLVSSRKWGHRAIDWSLKDSHSTELIGTLRLQETHVVVVPQRPDVRLLGTNSVPPGCLNGGEIPGRSRSLSNKVFRGQRVSGRDRPCCGGSPNPFHNL